MEVFEDERIVDIGGGEEALEGIAGDGGVEREIGGEGEVGEDREELIDGSGAGEDTGVAVSEMVTDTSESFVEIVFSERFAFFLEVVGPEGVKVFISSMERAVMRVSSTWTWAMMKPRVVVL